MQNFFILIIFLLMINSIKAQVPKAGNDTLFDIACWNIEWFGDATSGNGPGNEALQFTNVKNVLLSTDIDVWALEEVSDPTAWANLTAALPAYDNTITTYSWTQKTAMIWKKSMFDLISSGSVLTEQIYNYDFAGRPPLEVVLRTKNTSVTDTIYFYVVHLKAYGDQASYTRRQNAAGFIKTFLEANRAGKKVIVLGDWNDDLNVSIYANSVSPFLSLLNDSARYFFPTKQLCDQSKSSYITGSKMLDEQMITTPFRQFYVNASCRIINELSTYITGYLSDNTSDHYPVLSFYNMKRYPVAGIENIKAKADHIQIYPNPAEDVMVIHSTNMINDVLIQNITGQTISFSLNKNNQNHAEIKIDESVKGGVYFIQIKTDSGNIVSKFFLNR